MNAVSDDDAVQAPDLRAEGSMRREIGVLLGAALVVNATIGTGIFKTPAKVVRLTGSLPAALAIWCAGAFIALCGALTLAELAAAMPRTGGLYEYLRRAWGDRVAFLFGWAKLTLLIPSAVGSFARLAAESANSLAGLSPSPARDTRTALVFLAVCTGANLLGTRASARQQAAITVVKYASVVLLAVLGLALPAAHGIAPPAELPPFAATVSVGGCFAALVSCMWAYDGWADLASLSGEVRDPGRTLPRALLAGTIAIALVYLSANLGYARTLGLDGLRHSTSGSNMAAANLAATILGGPGRAVLSAMILVSCLGGCMSSLMTGPRVFVPLATDGLFIRSLGALSPHTAVPSRAIVVCAVLGGAYVTVRSFEQLTEAFVVGYFPFYAMAVLAVFELRRRDPAMVRPFRVPFFPLPPLLFLAGTGVLMWGALRDLDAHAWVAFAVMLAGLPLGWAWSRFASKPPASRPRASA
jgi:APA family basic amino acid/polyamine antiporter